VCSFDWQRRVYRVRRVQIAGVRGQKREQCEEATTTRNAQHVALDGLAAGLLCTEKEIMLPVLWNQWMQVRGLGRKDL